MMTKAKHMELARKLNEATTKGELIDAYKVIQGLSSEDAREIAKLAGFRPISVSAVGSKAFFTDLQKQVADACRAKVDGKGLQAMRKTGE